MGIYRGKYAVAYDLGTGGLKTALFEDRGGIVSSVYQEYKPRFEHPGQVEQDADTWWEAVCSSTKRILDENKIAPSKITYIIFTGQEGSIVPVDEEGNLTRRDAIVWMDTRGDKQARLFQDKFGWEKFYSITGRGQMLRILPFTKIMWIKENEPNVFKKTHKFLEAKDYIIFRLTGNFVTDLSEASNSGLLDIEKREWSEEILEASGISIETLPELHESIDVVGYVTKEASKEVFLKPGTPVGVGGGDSSCALAGVGLEEGECCIYIGSVMWVGIVTKKPLFDQKIRPESFCHLIPNTYNSHLCSHNGGVCYRWAREIFCDIETDVARRRGISAYEIMDLKASLANIGANGLFFLPYLVGGGAPYRNPDSRGAFIGLGLIHKKEDFLRSILEGIAYTARTFVELLESKSGEKMEKIYLVGGGAKSTLWQQIIADVLGIDVNVVSLCQEVSALGAVMAGGVAMGIFRDFMEAKNIVKVADIRKPKPEAHKEYNKRYSLLKNFLFKSSYYLTDADL